MKSLNKKTAIISFALIFTLAIVAVALIYIPRTMGNNAGEFVTDVVDVGTVASVIEAEGVVEPHNEVFLNSPANSTVLKVLIEAGSHVKAGEIVLLLDQRPIQEEIQNLEDQLEMKRNNLEKTMLNARSTRLDLDYNVETKKLKIASIKSQLADEEQLLEVGGISPARIEKTKQSLVSAEKDLKMTQEKNLIRLKQLEAEEEGLRLQIEMQERELEHKQNLLLEMYVKAPSSGIILKNTKKAGEKVRQDELLVTMSDLSSYKIIGSLDEKKAEMVKTGKTVYALIDNEVRLSGKVGNIQPVIENNKRTFDVFLDQSSHEKLIPNMRISLLLVNEKRDSVLRVKNGPAFDNKNRFQNVYFKVDENRAVLREVETGLKGFEYIELTSGAKMGDEIIISDISALRRKKAIDIH